jgi:hypothetical protein
VQPACLLYTKAVMAQAAAELTRVRATGGSDEVCRQYALRRLEAVPEVPLFHVGGREDWQVEVAATDGGATVEARISGHARPLPLTGAFVRALGEGDPEGVVLRAETRARVRPDWVVGDYGSWTSMWG